MKIRTIIVSLIALTAITLTSCLKTTEEEEREPRTKALEQAEREALLTAMIDDDLDVDTTALGVYYVIREEGEGPVIAPGATITIAYNGYHINGGGMFDSSQSWEFVYPLENLIEGFNDGLSIMKKDMIAEFIIPSHLAYGIYGSPPVIDSYETLLFAIKVIKVKPFSPDGE